MYLKTALDYLENRHPHPSFMVLCIVNNELYLLTWVGWSEDKNNNIWAFQPINKTAFYEFGIGYSTVSGGPNALRDYLEQCLDRGYELYVAYSFSQLANSYVGSGLRKELEQIIADPLKHKIVIDGTEVEISEESFKALKKQFCK